MPIMTLDAEAGRVSEDLGRRGISPRTRVRVLVELAETPDLPMAALAQAGGAFAFLADEPDVYNIGGLIERPA